MCSGPQSWGQVQVTGENLLHPVSGAWWLGVLGSLRILALSPTGWEN